MGAKKILILPIVVSIIIHALILSATGLVSIRTGGRTKDDIITVDLKRAEEFKVNATEYEKNESSLPPLNPSEAASNEGFPEETVSLDSSDERYAPYLTKIKEKIEEIWSYPHKAFERKIEGISTVRFSIDKSGKLVTNRIIKSSGYDVLDREAVSVVRAATPFEPFPQSIVLSRLHILATFRYRLM